MLLEVLGSFNGADKEAKGFKVLSVSEFGADQLGAHLLVHQLAVVSKLVAVRNKRKHHAETAKLASELGARARRSLGRPLLEELMHGIRAVENDHGLAHDIERADGSIELLVLGPVLVLCGSGGREVKEVTDNREGLGSRWKRKTCLLLRD